MALFKAVRAELQRTGQELPQGQAVDAVLVDSEAAVAAVAQAGEAMGVPVFAAAAPGGIAKAGCPVVALAPPGEAVGSLAEAQGPGTQVLRAPAAGAVGGSMDSGDAGLLATALPPDASLWVAALCGSTDRQAA